MPDLDAAIRAKLSPVYDPPWAMNQYRAALAAVLDLHLPRTAIESDVAGQRVCDECSDGTDDFLAKLWPCPTVLGIAKALGIEVS